MGRNWTLASLLLAAVPVTAQTFTARELFWGEGLEKKETKAPATAPSKRKAGPPPSKPTSPPKETEESRDRASAPVPDRQPAQSGAQYVNAKVETPKPLGLRYTVQKRNESGGYTEVDQDTRFRTGDRVRVVVESNDTGYLYVVQQGTSGKWETLFPSEHFEGGSNRIDRGQPYTLPAPGAVFAMRPPAGADRMFIVLSRQPLQDMEKLIYSLEDRTRPEPSQARPMLAQNIIPDGLVQKLRVQSRDLLIEKVDDAKPAAQTAPAQSTAPPRPSEKAVYVVNAAGGPNARVVADIELRHE